MMKRVTNPLTSALLLAGSVVILAGFVLTLAGCSAHPVPVPPARALAIASAHPDVVAWLEGHSAPRVLEGLNPAAARSLTRYRPVAMVDLGREGLLVRFDAALGPKPRRVEVVVDREQGQVLIVRMH